MPENSQRVSELERILLEDGWETSVPPAGPCPDPETIGALVAGTLPAEEREQVEAHLASCERCYEGYATAVTFLGDEECGEAGLPEQEGTVTPFRTASSDGAAPPARPRPASVWRWLPLAAALALGVVGLQAWRLAQPAQVVERLAASIDNPTKALPEVYALPVHRGPEDPAYEEVDRRIVSFQAGATLVDFELALADPAKITRDSRLRDVGGDLLEILRNAGFISQRAERLLERVESLDEGSTVSADFRKELRDLADEVSGSRLLNARFLELGAWAEAGRLAVRSGQPGFFQGFDGWRNHRFLEKALKLPDLVDEEDHRSLLEIRRLWPRDAGAKPSKELDAAFSSLVEGYGIDAGIPVFDDLDPLLTPTPPPQPGK